MWLKTWCLPTFYISNSRLYRIEPESQKVSYRLTLLQFKQEKMEKMSKDKTEKKDKSEKALAAEKEHFIKLQVNMQSRHTIVPVLYMIQL